MAFPAVQETTACTPTLASAELRVGPPSSLSVPVPPRPSRRRAPALEPSEHAGGLAFHIAREGFDLWLTLALDCAARGSTLLGSGSDFEAALELGRMAQAERLIAMHVTFIETLPEDQLGTVRTSLGLLPGEILPWPSLRALVRSCRTTWSCFARMMLSRGRGLDDVLSEPALDPGAFLVAEAMVDVECAFRALRREDAVASDEDATKGRLFPELLSVRDRAHERRYGAVTPRVRGVSRRALW